MSNVFWQTSKVVKAKRAELKKQTPFVIWITGLSGSGKSTLANIIDAYLYEHGFHSYLLDGDNVRYGLNKDLGFDSESRVENIRRTAEVAKLMVDAGLIVVAAFISPYRIDREMVRGMFESNEFIEVFLDVPLEICEQRDSKGLYKKARAGEIADFTGIDSPYQAPLMPEITIGNNYQTVEDELSTVINYLQAHQLLGLEKSAVS